MNEYLHISLCPSVSMCLCCLFLVFNVSSPFFTSLRVVSPSPPTHLVSLLSWLPISSLPLPCVCLRLSLILSVSSPPHQTHTHTCPKPLRLGLSLSWFPSRCLVTALPSSPVETIETGSLLAAIRLPFVLCTARGRSNYRQVLGADAFVHGPFRAQPAPGPRSRWALPYKTPLCRLSAPPLCSRTRGSSSWHSTAPCSRRWVGGKGKANTT